MSSWCRNSLSRPLILGLVSAAALGPLATVRAADMWWQSQVALSAESHDNYGLDPNPDGSSQDAETIGGVADLGGTWGISTPRSDTYVRPRVTLQEFSGRDDVSEFDRKQENGK